MVVIGNHNAQCPRKDSQRSVNYVYATSKQTKTPSYAQENAKQCYTDTVPESLNPTIRKSRLQTLLTSLLASNAHKGQRCQNRSSRTSSSPRASCSQLPQQDSPQVIPATKDSYTNATLSQPNTTARSTRPSQEYLKVKYNPQATPLAAERKFNIVVYGIKERPKGTHIHKCLSDDIKSVSETVHSICPDLSSQSIYLRLYSHRKVLKRAYKTHSSKTNPSTRCSYMKYLPIDISSPAVLTT